MTLISLLYLVGVIQLERIHYYALTQFMLLLWASSSNDSYACPFVKLRCLVSGAGSQVLMDHNSPMSFPCMLQKQTPISNLEVVAQF